MFPYIGAVKTVIKDVAVSRSAGFFRHSPRRYKLKYDPVELDPEDEIFRKPC